MYFILFKNIFWEQLYNDYLVMVDQVYQAFGASEVV